MANSDNNFDGNYWVTDEGNLKNNSNQKSPIEVTVPADRYYMAFRVGVMNGIGTNPTYSNLKLVKIS